MLYMPIMNDKVRSRLYSCVLYPEDESQQYAISLLSGKSYSSVGILHDRDVSINEETGEPTLSDETGEPIVKKPHYHFVIRFKNARYAASLAKELRIKLNYLEKSADFPSAVRYLIHKGWPDKFQYPTSELVGSLVDQAMEAMDDTSEGQRAVEILNMIEECPFTLSATQLIRMAALEGRWSDLRRGGQWFMQALAEHNDRMMQERYTYNK